MKKRLLSSLLSLCMLFSLLPVSALAEEGTPQGNDSWPTWTHEGIGSIDDTIDLSQLPASIDLISGEKAYNGSYYNQLDDASKAVYDAIYADNSPLKSGPSKEKIIIDLTGKTGADALKSSDLDSVVYPYIVKTISAALGALLYDHPELSWLVNTQFSYGKQSDTSIRYLMSETGYNQATNGLDSDVAVDDPETPTRNEKYGYANTGNRSDIETAISKAKTAINTALPTNASNYEKVKAIHTWICENMAYTDQSGDKFTNSWRGHQTAYSALVEGDTVCAGYAKSFKLLCDEYSIPCVIVTGNAGTSGTLGPHAWNYVQLNDGTSDKWYAVDCTWDDQDSGMVNTYFLVGGNTTGFNQTTFNASHVNGTLYSTYAFAYPALNDTEYIDPSAPTSIELTYTPDISVAPGKTPSFCIPTVDGLGVEKTTEYELTATVKDNDGNAMSGKTVEWSLSGNYEGITLTPNATDGNKAILKVTNLALKNYDNLWGPNVTVTASCSTTKGEQKFLIFVNTRTAKFVEILKNGSVVTTDSVTAGNSVTYTAKIYDQYGVEMDGRNVTHTEQNSQGKDVAVQKPMTIPDVTWTSSDTNSATVANGTVTASDGAAGKNVTITASSGSGSATVNISINAKGAHELTVPADQTLTYGDEKTAAATSGTGAVLTYSSSDAEVVSVDSTGKLTAKKAGTATITVTAPASNGYTQATGSFTVTVNKATPTASATVKGEIYSTSTTVAFEGTATYGGQPVPGTFALKGAFPGLPAVGQTVTFNWTFTPTDTTNYNTVDGTATATVQASTVTKIEVTTAPTKTEYVYGDEIVPAGMVLTVTKTDGTETISSGYTGVTFSTPSDAGTSVPVTVSYGGQSATFTVKVTPKPLTVKSAAADSRDYSGTATVKVTSVALEGVINGDDVSALGATGTLSSADAGTYTTVDLAGLALTGAKANCYSLNASASGVPTNVTINKATPAVANVSATGTVYTTTPLSAVNLTGSAANGPTPVDGTFALDADQALEAGTALYNYTFTPADTKNYNPVQGTVSITVLERTVSKIEVSGTLTKTNYEYGDTFDKAGVTVNAYYSDDPDTAVDVTDQASFNVNKLLTVGTIQVEITYLGKTAPVGAITVSKKAITFTPTWSASSFSFDGSEKTVTVTGVPQEVTVSYTGNTGTDAGSYSAAASFALASGYSADNYDLQVTADTHAWIIRQAAGGSHTASTPVKNGDISTQTVDLSSYIPANCGTISQPTVAASGTIFDGTPAVSGKELTFAITADAADGDTGTITIQVDTKNYTTITITVTVNVTDKDIPTLSVSDFTRVYNGKAVTASELTKSATCNGADVPGTWTFQTAAPTDVADSGAYTLHFTPDDPDAYMDGDASATITITKATPTGTPGYTAITASGKTLADAPLTTGTLSPSAGALTWVLPGTTVVQANTAYEWKFTPDSPNYNVLTGRITLYNYTQPSRPSGGGSSGGGSSSGSSSTPSGPVSTGSGTQNGDRVTQTTAKPSATVSGGTASSTITPATGKEIVDQAVKNDSDTVVIAPSIRNGVSGTEVTIPSSTVSDLGRKTGADVMVDTPVAQVVIPNRALSGLSKGDLTVSAQRQGSTLTVTVQTGSQTVYSVTGGLTVTAPASYAAAGTVAIQVNRDGSREVIRKSVVVDGVVTIPLSGTAKVEIVDNGKRFHDVPASNWAYNAVSFASGHELFNGTSENAFSPDTSMTRGMLAVVLHNLENNPSNNRHNSFSDVASSAWYAKAVSWAAEQGIVSGYPDGAFGANDSVTREQLAVMLYRYAGSPRTTSNRTSRFSDSASISSYAQTALNWAVENGIINGVGNNALDPQGLATRAQVAQMLKNFVEAQF